MHENYESNKEGCENHYYDEFLTSADEVKNILKEIDTVFLPERDQDAAENIVLEKWAPKMDAALGRLKNATDNCFFSYYIATTKLVIG